jgi:carboxymethylenebutenolidase
MAEVHSGRPGRTTADVEATRRWLIGQPTVDRDRLGVIGFCMGGGFALAFAAGGPDGLRAASVNYGEVPEDAEALRRVCPVVASYGGRDRVVGPQAGHAFMTPGKRRPLTELVMFPTHPGYEPESAGDAWARVLRFFDEHVRKGRATR